MPTQQYLPYEDNPNVPPPKMKWPEILLVTGIAIVAALFVAAYCSGHVREFRERRALRRGQKKQQWPKPSRAELMNRSHNNQSEEELVGGYYK
ncbi:hypothetical protein PG985_011215 [Apiospora marii]|uniref:Uncharacterized protein n=1 Tax=Apiospora marii TaxID=335849 RepID=A0ABR1ST26_9PEZI